ncbi:MAG: hydrogenase accessory protein HypB, partial [Desulfosarcina sp.]|nr:hydrogenase accessory protein HypB [Desulfobacterales bacterium]
YDIKLAAANILQIHPGMPVFETSAKTEEGFEPWLEWLRNSAREKLQ